MKIYRKQVILYNSDDCEIVIDERFSTRPFGEVGEIYDEDARQSIRINEIEVKE